MSDEKLVRIPEDISRIGRVPGNNDLVFFINHETGESVLVSLGEILELVESAQNEAIQLAIDGLMNGASSALDIFKEFEAAINNDQNFVMNVMSTINTKLAKEDFKVIDGGNAFS